MKLLIMRHGEAESLQVNDEDRCLTDRGIQEASLAGQWLQQEFKHIDFAIVSPYKRTLQTFFTLQEQVDIKHDVLSADVIPSGNPDLVHDYIDCVLAEERQVSSVLIVSHMPIVSYLVDTLTGIEKSVLFPTAAIAQLNYKTHISRGEYLGLHTV